MPDEEWIYDEASGEWGPASGAAQAEVVQVRDAVGTLLADGDSVVLTRDLKVKGAGQTLKQGTVIRSIRLTDDPAHIDCRHDSIKGLVLRTEFVRKR
ncbi:PhnA protein [Salipiger aestuarii]|uniref:Alkylphosphonate utilization operon protein PhnA n=1 Tax=Salipiger aestuarii TaxID=568098 RepID=A0A327YGK1_9RHOB|nr:alkylphosphonate utilization protein [Salipiger aestuarii]EIE52189.1 alkylphosphonate uptake protein [Citreicella sp. 357]KAA8608409.1 PhnA protein [Salipiger aestuarii]KAA8612314.1 PhnA protein [Salipiger aestuarii]KAB2541447.1 PhnA protein [Salipiger aestuarii]RAK20100.1 alkylphosphonate utilization operon protein PhnA [Salipiger aestuarii]